jgi:hypothetical protein
MKRLTTTKINLSYQELVNLHIHEFNRCGYITQEEALKHNQSVKDWDAFIKRCEATLNDIKKNGYLETSMIITAKCKEDGRTYLIEGQGRRGAIILGFENKKLDPETHNLLEIPSLHYEQELTYAEIAEKIREHNLKKSKPWKTNDIMQIDALIEGGECLEAYNIIKKYREKNFRQDGIYTCNMLHYGGKCSHIRGHQRYLSVDNFREYYKIFTILYEEFINNFAKESSLKEHIRYRKVRSCEFSILWESFLVLIKNICIKHGLNVEEHMKKASDYLSKWSNNKKTKTEDILNFLSLRDTDKYRFVEYINFNNLYRDIFGSEQNEDILNTLYGWPYVNERKTKKVG